MADPTPGPAMATELVDIPLVPAGGRQVQTHPQALQNRRLLPLGDLVSRFTIWMLESETNNVGSVVTPGDAKNAQKFKATLKRIWDRTRKFNRSGAGTLEFTHPIRFVAMAELQKMPSTPFRQLAYLLWDHFQVLLGQQGSKLQTFIDEAAIDEIEQSLLEIIEFIDVEIGDGTAKGEGTGTFNLGAGMPTTSRVGLLQPTPLHGNVSVSEPTTDAPPDIPPDSADLPNK